MDNTRNLSRLLETAAWGAVFIWWGATELFQSLPHGVGAIGLGLILLGLNAARSLNGIRASRVTTTLGILAVLLGVLELASAVLSLPFQLPIFAILLIALGVILLLSDLPRFRTE